MLGFLGYNPLVIEVGGAAGYPGYYPPTNLVNRAPKWGVFISRCSQVTDPPSARKRSGASPNHLGEPPLSTRQFSTTGFPVMSLGCPFLTSDQAFGQKQVCIIVYHIKMVQSQTIKAFSLKPSLSCNPHSNNRTWFYQNAHIGASSSAQYYPFAVDCCCSLGNDLPGVGNGGTKGTVHIVFSLVTCPLFHSHYLPFMASHSLST